VGSVSQATDYIGVLNADLILKYSKDLSDAFNLDLFGGGNYYQVSQRSEATGITNLLVPGFYNLSNTSFLLQQPISICREEGWDYMRRQRFLLKINCI
jgi:hypothetical protein